MTGHRIGRRLTNVADRRHVHLLWTTARDIAPKVGIDVEEFVAERRRLHAEARALGQSPGVCVSRELGVTVIEFRADAARLLASTGEGAS